MLLLIRLTGLICSLPVKWLTAETGNADVTSEGITCTTEGYIDATLSSLRRWVEVSGVI